MAEYRRRIGQSTVINQITPVISSAARREEENIFSEW